jgi:ribosomal protein S6--L-glutamate ligase
MRIEYLLARRVPDVPSPVLRDVNALLERRGHIVTGWVPEARLTRADTRVPEADLYLLKSHTELALSEAGLLHDQGARLLNPFLSCVTAQDKITASRRLRAAGVPSPATWITGDLSQAAHLLADGPLVVKPHRGHRGVGVSVVRTPAELAAVPDPGTPLVVQRYVPGPGEDLKVYVAGDQVFAVRKPFDAESFMRPGRPVPVSREVRAAAAGVRDAFGLDLFGVDVIEGVDGPVVVDVNYFPGYKGVPDAAPFIAGVIDAWARSGAARAS